MQRGFLALLFFLVLLHSPAFPQAPALEKPVSFIWDKTTLAFSIDQVCKAIDLNLAYDSKILPDTLISGTFEGVPAGKLLEELLAPHPLSYTLKANTLILVQREELVQPRFFTMSGYVEDAESGERLPGATVYDIRSKKGVVANEAGFFSLKLPLDSVKIVVSVVGYAVHIERFKGQKDLRRIMRLRPDLELGTVEILEDRNVDGLDGLAGVGVVNVPIKELELLPSLLGEPDVFTMLKLYPGVHSGGDGSSGLYVRGGGPDQNLVLLDGVPIYNSSHLFGFYSIFNADAIQGIELYKGGFPARYGGRLSSVININMKDGDANQLHGELDLGLSTARAFIEGPLWKGKTTFVLAARRTILEPYFKVVNIVEGFRNGNSVDYNFFDLNAKVTHRFSDRDRLFMTLYKGGDRFGSGYFIDTSNVSDLFDFKLNWGNTASVVRWRRDWSKRIFSDLSTFTTTYNYKASSVNELDYLGQDSSRTELDITSRVRDYGVRGEVEVIPGSRHFIRAGFNSTYHEFLPETFTQLTYRNTNDTVANYAGQKQIRSLENYVFLEENLNLGPLRMNMGLNAALYLVDSSQYTSLQPRFSARLKLPHDFALEGNLSSMVQYMHLLTNAGVGLPTDLWVPATGRIPPQRAMQASFGIEKEFKELNLELGVEAYGKQMRQLIEYQTGINFLGSNDWQDLVETGGRGLSYGIECLLRRHTGRFTSTVGYTYSRTTRQFPTINFGEPFFYKYDRTHDFSASGIFQLNERMSFSADWVYGTGNAITFPKGLHYAPTSNILGFWDLNEGPNLNVIIDYGKRNSFRIPPYHRLDINYTIRWGNKNLKWDANIGIFNVYNRRNPYFLFLRADYSDDPNLPEIKARKMSLLPILPALKIGCRF